MQNTLALILLALSTLTRPPLRTNKFQPRIFVPGRRQRKAPGRLLHRRGLRAPNGKGAFLTLFGNAPHKPNSRYSVPDKGAEKPRRSGPVPPGCSGARGGKRVGLEANGATPPPGICLDAFG